jgi:hypothetical protein
MLRPLPRDWFAVQLRFAERAAAILGLGFEEAVETHTGCARSFGLSWRDIPDGSLWQEFLRGLRIAEDRAGWAYDFALRSRQGEEASKFGCFSYDFVPETRQIRIHFRSNDTSGLGTLSRARWPERRRELSAMFAEVAQAHPEAATVRGNSWLYGIEAYRRLFPPEYWQTAIPVPTETEFQYMALWGQFLRHDGQVKTAIVERFLAEIKRAQTVAELAAAFPHGVYEVECAIEHFYASYWIEGGRDAG